MRASPSPIDPTVVARGLLPPNTHELLGRGVESLAERGSRHGAGRQECGDGANNGAGSGGQESWWPVIVGGNPLLRRCEAASQLKVIISSSATEDNGCCV